MKNLNRRNSNFFVLLVVMMILNLSLFNALNISDIRVEDVTESSAIVIWNTDEPANGFVSYGSDKEQLEIMGDNNKLTEHSFYLSNLNSETTYYYQVESDSTQSDILEFKTSSVDTTLPEITLEIPSKVKGENYLLNGTTKVNSEVSVYVNKIIVGKKSISDGNFQFNLNFLVNQDNEIKVKVEDSSGNVVEKEWIVYADSTKPQLFLEEMPEVIQTQDYPLKGTFSENVTYTIYANNRSLASGEGKELSATINLEEGVNVLNITYQDEVGWKKFNLINLTSDALPPEVTMTLKSGAVYYQGRAYSDITGQTKPGAKVYLYVYRPLTYEYKPDFKNARQEVKADGNGTFKFDNVNFEFEGLNLDVLKPKEVPTGLLDYSVPASGDLTERQTWSYYIFVIVEDSQGRTAYDQETISINTCYSPNQDFSVQSIVEFLRPLRLNPTLLDQGKEQINAAFELKYRGNGQAKVDPLTGDVLESGYRIVSDLRVEAACTQSMIDWDSGVELGCKLTSNSFRVIPNANKTSWYMTSNIKAAEEFSKNSDNFWNDFKDRRMTIPIKVSFTYQERLGETSTSANELYGEWGPTKTQVACIDLGYFIDVPIESKQYVPDWLADEGVKGINATLKVINAILPKLEIAIKVVGVACISSFLSRMVVRWWRIASANIEGYKGTAEKVVSGASESEEDDKDEKCPLVIEQNKLYLDKTMEKWEEIINEDPEYFGDNTGGIKKVLEEKEKNSLNERCPSTARLWEMEAALDQAYKWSCDRMYCRAVPAGWTQTADKADVESVILKQNSCAFTALGVPLLEVKDCDKLVKSQGENIVNLDANFQQYLEKANQGSFTCYRYNDRFYVVDPNTAEKLDDGGSKVKLSLVTQTGMSIQTGLQQTGTDKELFAYKPANEDVYYVGREQSCENICKQNDGYVSVGCYDESKDESGNTILLLNGQKMTKNMYSAGYTSGEKPCFINDGKKQQCVCEYKETATTPNIGARVAEKKKNNTAEDWIYRQDRIYQETKKMQGVYYPEWRYYHSRDFSSAFGADYLTDYFRAEDEKTVHEVNPHNQFIGAWQTICLPRIRAQIVTLKNILEGLRGCIQEAKYSSFQDSSTCKTIFSQHVCGLMYKLISYLASDCTPYGYGQNEKSESMGSVENFFKSGFQGIEQSMQSSINDIQSDYGNAQLNNFFATGAQGFAQSLCMAAFGFDFPMGMDFIMDSAYAVEGKTTVNVVPAERELVSYNPTTGTAIYNYNIGGYIMSGCKINSVDVYLKAITQKDLSYPNTQDCSKSDGCDLLNVQTSTVVEQTYKLQQSQTLTNIQPNDVVDLRIEAPQRVDSFYRYDHVVVQLNIDPMSSAENCFDEGYRDGKFYFPIRDVSPPAQFECQADIFSGQYKCASILEKFGGPTGSYLANPYITCWDEKSQSYVACDTPNLFVIGTPLRAKVNIMSDGKGQCVQARVTGLGDQTLLPTQAQPLLDGITGSYGYTLDLGTVNADMFGDIQSNFILDVNSAKGCSNPTIVSGLTTTASAQTFSFSYSKSDGNYKVTVPSGLTVDSPYMVKNSILELNGQDQLTSSQIQEANFSYQGYKIKNLVGAPETETGSCIYSLQSFSDSSSRNKKAITLTIDLLQKPENGCFYTKDLVKVPAYGKARHSQTIYIQKETEQDQQMDVIHQEFLNKNYNYVLNTANAILLSKDNDNAKLKAIYYAIASHLMVSELETKKVQIENILKQMENLKVDNTPVNEQIKVYLCVIANKINYKGNFCNSVNIGEKS
jgi:hypothetical protein